MLFAMDTPLWAFALCCFGCMVLCSQGQQSCTDMFEITEDEGTRTVTFQHLVDQPESNTYIEITVYVTNICQKDLCEFTLDTDTKNMRLLYRKRMPLTYKVHFRGESMLAGIKGIAVRNSKDCTVLCENPQDKVEPGDKSMSYGFYPHGRSNFVKANCDPMYSFLHFNISNDARIYRTNFTLMDETCGLISPKFDTMDLAIGGIAIKRGSWPWLVAIYRLEAYDNKFICGGTLISKRIVLTASHCLYDPITKSPLQRDELVLFMGRHDLADFNEQHYFQYNVSDVVTHKDFRESGTKFDADIGFLVTIGEVEYTDFIKPACVWDEIEEIDSLVGDKGRVIGWGVDETQKISSIPRRVNGTIVSDKDCMASDSSYDPLTTKRNFCAGNRDGTGPCLGDSGGAFMLLKNNKWTIRGTLSFSLQKQNGSTTECDTENYAVYSDVAKFKLWLDTEIDKLNN